MMAELRQGMGICLTGEKVFWKSDEVPNSVQHIPCIVTESHRLTIIHFIED